ncbi:hypothetical protein B0H13DRAFT_2050830, partial [Mycena leptocephala]
MCVFPSFLLLLYFLFYFSSFSWFLCSPWMGWLSIIAATTASLRSVHMLTRLASLEAHQYMRIDYSTLSSISGSLSHFFSSTGRAVSTTHPHRRHS